MLPILFYLPGVHLPIYSYGVMLGTSLIVGWYIVLGLCERDGMNREKMGNLYVWTAVCSVAGSRLLYVITNLDRFDSVFDVFKVNQGGLVAYGGFIGGFLTGIVYCRLNNIRLIAWADCVVPSLGTGLAMTRIGCLAYGCDYGKPTNVAWALRFPRGSPAYVEQVKDHIITNSAATTVPIHPTQVYEMINGLVLFGLVMLVRRYRKFSGEMFATFVMGYAVLRYFVEDLRADDQRGTVGPFSTSQFIGIVTFGLAAWLMYTQWRKWQKDPQSVRYWELPALDAATAGPSTNAPSASHKKRRKKK